MLALATKHRHTTGAGYLSQGTRDRHSRVERLLAGRLFQRAHLYLTSRGVDAHTINMLPELQDREETTAADARPFSAACARWAPEGLGAADAHPLRLRGAARVPHAATRAGRRALGVARQICAMRSTSIEELGVLATRLILGMIFVAQGLAGLRRGFPVAPATWFPADLPPPLADGYAGVLLGLGLLLIAGLWTWRAALASGFFLVVVTAQAVVKDPLHKHDRSSAPLLRLVCLVLFFAPQLDQVSLDRRLRPKRAPPRDTVSWVAPLRRLFLGAIFLAQGVSDAFFSGGLLAFAEKVYVEPHASLLPRWMLGAAGVLNPPTQVIGALLVIVGAWARRPHSRAGVEEQKDVRLRRDEHHLVGLRQLHHDGKRRLLEQIFVALDVLGQRRGGSNR